MVDLEGEARRAGVARPRPRHRLPPLRGLRGGDRRGRPLPQPALPDGRRDLGVAAAGAGRWAARRWSPTTPSSPTCPGRSRCGCRWATRRPRRWPALLRDLLADPERLRAMGEAAREHVRTGTTRRARPRPSSRPAAEWRELPPPGDLPAESRTSAAEQPRLGAARRRDGGRGRRPAVAGGRAAAAPHPAAQHRLRPLARRGEGAGRRRRRGQALRGRRGSPRRPPLARPAARPEPGEEADLRDRGPAAAAAGLLWIEPHLFGGLGISKYGGPHGSATCESSAGRCSSPCSLALLGASLFRAPRPPGRATRRPMPCRRRASPGTSTSLLRAQDYDRFGEQWGRARRGSTCRAATAGQRSLRQTLPLCAGRRPFVRLAPVRGGPIANALLLAAAALLGLRLAQLWGHAPLWVAVFLFASVAFAYVFLGPPTSSCWRVPRPASPWSTRGAEGGRLLGLRRGAGLVRRDLRPLARGRRAARHPRHLPPSTWSSCCRRGRDAGRDPRRLGGAVWSAAVGGSLGPGQSSSTPAPEATPLPVASLTVVERTPSCSAGTRSISSWGGTSACCRTSCRCSWLPAGRAARALGAGSGRRRRRRSDSWCRTPSISRGRGRDRQPPVPAALRRRSGSWPWPPAAGRPGRSRSPSSRRRPCFPLAGRRQSRRAAEGLAAVRDHAARYARRAGLPRTASGSSPRARRLAAPRGERFASSGAERASSCGSPSPLEGP